MAPLLALTAVSVTAQAQPASKVSRYVCAANVGELKVKRSGGTALVTLLGRTYALLHKHSSIGDKFISSRAALIIDGNSAVFVSEDHLNLGPCTGSIPLAAAAQ